MARHSTLNLDARLSRYLRRLGQRRLRLSTAASGLPPPAAGRNYLLYLHIPFCKSLCPFCSFHRVMHDHATAGRYFDALRREIDLVSGRGYRFDEIYVGGGTPTIEAIELGRTIQQVRAAHPLEGVSVESNPDDLVGRVIEPLVAAGVNRLSVGVQSFDDTLLEEMQRLDPYGSGREIIARLRRVEGVFDTLNVDMIFNFPHQNEKSLQRDLGILTNEIGVDQVSFYPLMTLSDTRERMLRAVGEVDYSREESLYRMIVEHMLGAGYQRASVWCFSRRPGMYDEYIAERDEYVGLGSGAFSHLDASLYASTFSIPDYLRLVDAGSTATVGRMDMSDRDRMRYYLLMRLFGGELAWDRAEASFGPRFRRSLWPELAFLAAYGAVRDNGDRLVLTEKGAYLWVVLMREFFSGINSLREQMRHGLAPGTRGPA